MITIQINEKTSHAKDLVKVLKTLPYVSIIGESTMQEAKLRTVLGRSIKQARSGKKTKDLTTFLNEV